MDKNYKVQVRYIVNEMEPAIKFYTRSLGFTLVMNPSPAFAMLSLNNLRLVLSVPNPSAGGGQPMPDGTQQTPGGWNRISIEVSDISQKTESLKMNGIHFRNEIVTGVGGKQIIIEDPSGNPIELFESTIESARFSAKS